MPAGPRRCGSSDRGVGGGARRASHIYPAGTESCHHGHLRAALILSLILTILNYIVLTGYDRLAFAYIGKVLPWRRIVGTSFVAYAIANNVGFPALSGAWVRYHFYARWGVTAEELSRIVIAYSVTFWLGLLALAGMSVAFSPLPRASVFPGRCQPAAGWLLMLVPLAYIATCGLRRTPLRLWRLQLALPTRARHRTTRRGLALEWSLAATVLYVLLPPSPLSFVEFLGTFVVAIPLGAASHVPGGVGVFEGVVVLLLRPLLSAPQLLPPLVLFRVIYYFLPFVSGSIALIVDEARQRRGKYRRAATAVGIRQAAQNSPRRFDDSPAPAQPHH